MKLVGLIINIFKKTDPISSFVNRYPVKTFPLNPRSTESYHVVVPENVITEILRDYEEFKSKGSI